MKNIKSILMVFLLITTVFISTYTTSSKTKSTLDILSDEDSDSNNGQSIENTIKITAPLDGQEENNSIDTRGWTLLCVHGIDAGAGKFNDYLDASSDFDGDGISDFVEVYGRDNIKQVDYWANPDPEFVGSNALIEDIAAGLKNYIIGRHETGEIKDNVDIVAHSMGGLVVRYMIKHYYNSEILPAGVTIRHVATAGTPNHGTWMANIVYLAYASGLLPLVMVIATILQTAYRTLAQGLQCATISPFMMDLNTGDETPYNIIYNTYTGDLGPDYWLGVGAPILISANPLLIFPILSITNLIGSNYDTMVTTGSVQLAGAVHNNYYAGMDHEAVKSNFIVKRDIFKDLQNRDVPDDDNTAPNVNIEYNGDETDSNPGQWIINISDQETGLDEIKILLNGNEIIHEYLNGVKSKQYSITVPNELGSHELEVVAVNNDYDWTGDQQSETKSSAVFIKDDDTTPPELTIGYNGDGTIWNPGKWLILTRDIESSIKRIEIKVDGKVIDYVIEPAGPIGYIYIIVDVPNTFGPHILNVYVENNDNDRPGDSEISIRTHIVYINPFIIW